MRVPVFIFALLASVHIAQALEDAPQSAPEGAVLCSYMLVSTYLTIQAQCFPEDADLNASLSDAQSRHRGFVLRNSEATPEVLDAFESQHSQLRGMTCEELEDRDFLPIVRDISNDLLAFQSTMDRILLRDRDPVWNPCL